MKLISVTFDYDGSKRYEKLAKVLAHSAEKNCPGASFELISIPAPKVKSTKRAFESNTVKLDLWLQKLRETTEDVVFMDCDMIILRDLQHVFDEDKSFDIGYTIRDGKFSTRMPMNGGIVFVRNTPAAIDFIEKWNEANKLMYKDIIENRGTKLHAYWRQRFAGMNQAAFGYLTTGGVIKYEAKLKKLLCSEYNSCIEHWPTVGPHTHVLHIKGNLRSAVMCSTPTQVFAADIRECVRLWRELASEIALYPKETNIILGVTAQIPATRKVQQMRISRHMRRFM